MNLGSLLSRNARYRPDHTGFVIGGEKITFRDLDSRVNRLAHGLLAAGLKKGDKLATVLPNCEALMLAYWAAAKTGIVIVPMSPLLLAGGLISLLRDADTAMVLTNADFAETMNKVRVELPHLTSNRCVMVDGAADGNSITYDALIDGMSGAEPPDARLSDHDVYNIMYSSGTTGAPKGIVHDHYVRAMYCSIFASNWRMGPESVVLHAGSIVFNGSMIDLMPWMFTGCTYILHEAFDAGRVIADIERHQVSHMIMVPAQIIALLSHPDFDPDRLASLEMLQNLGAPLLLEHKKRLSAQLPGRFYELYGLTEGFLTVLDKLDAKRKEGSVGIPPPFFEMRILREDGSECDAGETGEICGRGPMMMQGYYKRPDLTEQAVRDGWLYSGDAGYVDEDGYLYLVDRIKDMIITGGVNVYPKDIEEIIARHEAVSEVAVFGAPNEKWGEVPVAAVVARAGQVIDVDALVAWTNEQVDAKFQRIHGLIVLDDLPRNIAGKTLKRELRERHQEMAR